MLNTMLQQYVALVETFGFVATWLLILYAGALVAMTVCLACLVLHTWYTVSRARLREWQEQQRIARELEARDRLNRILQASVPQFFRRGPDNAA